MAGLVAVVNVATVIMGENVIIYILLDSSDAKTCNLSQKLQRSNNYMGNGASIGILWLVAMVTVATVARGKNRLGPNSKIDWVDIIFDCAKCHICPPKRPILTNICT